MLDGLSWFNQELIFPPTTAFFISDFYLYTSVSLYLRWFLFFHSFHFLYIHINFVARTGWRKKKKKEAVTDSFIFFLSCTNKLPCTVQTTVCIHTSLTIISLSFLFCLFLNNIVHSCNIERSDPLVLYMLIFFCKGLVLVFDFIFVDMIKKKDV